MKALLLCCFLLSTFSVTGLGQTATSPAANLPGSGTVAGAPASVTPQVLAKYSAEPAVIERADSIFNMHADGTGWRQTTMVVRVQSDAAVKQYSVLIIPYEGDFEHVEISYVRVVRPDGSVIETPASAAIDLPNPVTQAAPIYSDLKDMEVPIRSLSVGDTVESQVKVVRTKAETPGEFWGEQNFVGDNTVALSESLELRVPKNTYINVWSPTNKPSVTTTGDEKIYRWTATQKKPTVGKEAEAAKKLKDKQVWTAAQELDAKEGKLPAVAWSTFKSWQDVGDWYRKLEGDRIVPDAAIKAKVAELTAGKTTDEEKARAVYRYVAGNIHYIGVSFGVGRFQPHAATQVLQNQYGDCKDKATLLAAMLSAVGLQPDTVLIGAQVRFNEAVPSPASFNHVITKVSVDGKDAWLDSTIAGAPFNALLYAIRDKNALVIPETGAASVERTPANLPFAQYRTLDATGSMDAQDITNSHIVWKLRGDSAILTRTLLMQVSPALYDKFVQQFSQSIGYAGTTSNAEIDNLGNPSLPLQISYDYKRENAGDWADHKILPQVAPVGLPTVNADDPPVRAIRLGFPGTETSTSAMKLPEGWSAVLPKDVHAKSEYATYDETYRFDKGTVYATRRIEILKEKVPVADWKSYKKWTDAVDLGNEQYIQLTPAAGAGTTAGKNTPDVVNDPAAAKLIQSAQMSFRQRDFESVRSLLDQAKKLNPRQWYLWAEYGYLAVAERDLPEAVADFKKELSFYPQNNRVYPSLVAIDLHLKQTDDAKAALHQWAANDPTNPLPYKGLIALLLSERKASEAVVVGDTALAKLPDLQKHDDSLQLLIGRAQMAAGMKDKGRATLVAILQSTQNPEMMNDAAYELADANVELPLAESKTRAALAKMDATSQTWTLDEDPAYAGVKSRLFFATWDTMGWILYREGKLDAAESYLEAAWRNAASVTMAEHLGQVQLAKGEKRAALRTFELGLASISHPYGMLVVNGAPGSEESKLQARIDALKKAGVRSAPVDNTQALQNLRTFRLGPAHGMSGSGQYWVLLSDGTVKQEKAIGTSHLPGGEERLKQMKLTGYWPAGSQANIVRRGILFCGLSGCQFVEIPVMQVRPVAPALF